MIIFATGIAKDNGMSTNPDSVHQDTLAARYAVNTDDNHGAVIPPLYMSSYF